MQPARLETPYRLSPVVQAETVEGTQAMVRLEPRPLRLNPSGAARSLAHQEERVGHYVEEEEEAAAAAVEAPPISGPVGAAVTEESTA
jgi:hypothetical protein